MPVASIPRTPFLRRFHWGALVLWVALATTFAAIKLLEHYSFRTNDFDTGIYSNLAWNIAHGKGFYSSVLNKNHLGEHFSPIMVFLAPFMWAYPSANVLMIAQALAVAAAFPLLYWACREIFKDMAEPKRTWLSAGMVFLALLYRPLLSGLWFQFHPSTLGMPLVALAILCLHRRKDLALWIAVASLLLTKEVAIGAVLGLAIYAWVVLDRRKLGVLLGATAVVAAAAVFLFIMPAFQDSTWRHYSRLAPPALPWLKAQYLFLLAAGLGFLPLVGWRALLAALPLTLVNLSVGDALQLSLNHQYDDQNCVFWIIAAAHGARRAALMLEARAAAAKVKAAIAAAVLALAVVFAGRIPFVELCESWPDANTREVRRRLEKYARLPPDVPVAAHSGLGPRLCNRYNYVSLRAANFPPRFAPGQVVVLSEVMSFYDINYDAMRAFLRSPGNAETLEADGFLEVYRWTGKAGRAASHDADSR